MDFRIEESNSYRVEVSGWDTRENFFVEKTILSWEEGGKKEIVMKASLRPGSVLFVRLLQVIATGNNFPIAYQAIAVEQKDRNERCRVSLRQLRPREGARQELRAVAVEEAKETVGQVA